MVDRRWLMLAILFAARTAIVYQVESLAAASFARVRDTGFDYACLGLLIGCHMLPGIVLALPGSQLAQRFGGKPIMLTGLALGGLARWRTSRPPRCSRAGS